MSSNMLVLWPLSSRSLALMRYWLQLSSSSCLIAKYLATALDLYGKSEFFFNSVFFNDSHVMLPVSFLSVDITHSWLPFNLATAISTADSLPLSASNSICSSHKVVSALLLPWKELIASKAACWNRFLLRHWKLSTNFSLMLAIFLRPALIMLMDLLLLWGYSYCSSCCFLDFGLVSRCWRHLVCHLLSGCCCSPLVATLCKWFISFCHWIYCVTVLVPTNPYLFD